ncbi:2551_t:CDS:2, partial [Gigaspora margarita]
HNEQIIDLSSFNNPSLPTIQNTNSLSNSTSSTSFTNSPWIISSEMQQIIDKFENEILCQFLCVPCSICSKLMYPEKSMWIQQESNTTYPLINAYPNITLTTNPIPPPNRIAICRSCKSNPNQNYSQYLFSIPTEIELVLLEKRRSILPLYMIDSLDNNPYWSDKIEKYFACSNNPEFNSVIYKTYYEIYEIKSTRPNTCEDKILISHCIDIIDGRICSDNTRNREFTSKTNLPNTIRIQPACTNCQQKHAKCSGGATCKRCAQHNLVCTFNDSVKRRGPKKNVKHPEQIYVPNSPENDFYETSMLSSVILNPEQGHTSTLSFPSEYLRQPDNFDEFTHYSNYSNFYEDQNIYLTQEISPVSHQTYTDTSYIIDNTYISNNFFLYDNLFTKVIDMPKFSSN